MIPVFPTAKKRLCSIVWQTRGGTPEALQKKKELWQFLKLHDRRVYKRCLLSVAGACNLPGKGGRAVTLWGYRVAQKIFKFN